MSLYTGFGIPKLSWNEDEQCWLSQYKNGCTTNPTTLEIVLEMYSLCNEIEDERRLNNRWKK